MTCPFLKQTDVKLCRLSAYRKMIIPTAEGTGAEKCSSPAHVTCPIYRQQACDSAAAPDCPYLQQNRVEYCAAVPVQRFVARDESQLSRCTNESHRYCDAYLGLDGRADSEDIQALAKLYYSGNHMWLDVAEDGWWHVGVDYLLARVMGTVDSVTFVTLGGTARPSAVLTVNGWDFEMVFPNPLPIAGVNPRMRSDPSRLSAAPYTHGWLFEGQLKEAPAANGCTGSLRHGTTALGWMLGEMARVSEFAGGPYMADGGTPSDVLRQLGRDRARQLFHEFFSLARVGVGR